MAANAKDDKVICDKKSFKSSEFCKTKTVSVTVCITCGNALHRICLKMRNKRRKYWCNHNYILWRDSL